MQEACQPGTLSILEVQGACHPRPESPHTFILLDSRMFGHLGNVVT